METSKLRVRKLMGKVQKLLQDLGLKSRSLGVGPEQTNALAVASGVTDVKKHKNAMVKAKDEKLPKIFEQIASLSLPSLTWK